MDEKSILLAARSRKLFNSTLQRVIYVISSAILVISGIGLYFSVPYVFSWFFCKFLDCVLDI